MNNNLVELVCIVDMSGSMQSCEEAAIEGFDGFIQEQKKTDKDVRVTLLFFDNRYIKKTSNEQISKVLPIKEYGYRPYGSTALYDAIGRTIDDVGIRLKHTKEEERPSKVIFVIQTDGYENSSQKYNLDTIKTMIEHQINKYSWEFLFLASGLKEEVENRAMDMGIYNSFSYDNTNSGYRNVYCETKSVVSSMINNDAEQDIVEPIIVEPITCKDGENDGSK